MDDDKQTKASAARKREATAEAEDIKSLMAVQWGRRIVWRLLADAGVFRLSFNTEPLLMAFAEGGRSSGLRLMAQVVRLCPEHYTTMQKENQS